MIDVTKMTPDRYSRMLYAKRLYKFILDALQAGKRIQVTTYTTSRIYTSTSQFKADKFYVYSQRGKHWDCINLCSVRAIQ